MLTAACATAVAPVGGQSDSTVHRDTTRVYRPETYRAYLLNTFGPVPVLRSAALAGFDQWRGHPIQFPRNGRGYADRFSSRGGQTVIAHTIRFAAARALDERQALFSRCGCEGVRARLAHAMATPYLVDSPRGRHTSMLTPLSDLTSGVLVTSVHPGGFSVGEGLRSGLTGLAASSLIAAGREFWPFRWRPPGV